MSVQPTECLWQIDQRQLSGMAWGDPSRPPVLALHGWLDNAASFDALAERLPDFYVVAPDLAGHGRSEWRSPDAGYQIWDDLDELFQIVHQQGWRRFAVMGHSRGAMVAALLASVAPERVSAGVFLDALLPVPVPEADFCAQLRQYLRDREKLRHERGRRFDTRDEALEFRREKANLTEQGVQALARRGLVGEPAGFHWVADPRLRGASAVKMSPGQREAVLRGLTMPAMLWLSEWGERNFAGYMETVRACVPHLIVHKEGKRHHGHMDEAVAPLARNIRTFLLDAVA